MTDKLLSQLTDDDLEVGRKAVEDVLVEWRDSRMSILGRNNGLVIKEKDGSDSSIIRLGFEEGMRIAAAAIQKQCPTPAGGKPMDAVTEMTDLSWLRAEVDEAMKSLHQALRVCL